jgi:hypothetical protein
LNKNGHLKKIKNKNIIVAHISMRSNHHQKKRKKTFEQNGGAGYANITKQITSSTLI